MRDLPLADLDLPAGALGGATLGRAPPARRWILQGDGGGAGPALGLPMPDGINRATEAGGRAILRLGPDEWLLIDETPEGGAEAALARALDGAAHGLVDVSHRQTGLLLAGPGAVDVLAAGVPLDLHQSAFPVAMATRTLFEKVEIVLWRQGGDAFRIEVWRSFAPYLAAHLVEAMRTAEAFRQRG
jgi:sarcosine oxidase, subunit gamma